MAESKNPQVLTDEQVREEAIKRGLIKVLRSEEQVEFEAAEARLNAQKAEIFTAIQAANFPGPVEIRLGVSNTGEEFLTAIRTRKPYKKREAKVEAPTPAPVAEPAKKAKKATKA